MRRRLPIFLAGLVLVTAAFGFNALPASATQLSPGTTAHVTAGNCTMDIVYGQAFGVVPYAKFSGYPVQCNFGGKITLTWLDSSNHPFSTGPCTFSNSNGPCSYTTGGASTYSTEQVTGPTYYTAFGVSGQVCDAHTCTDYAFSALG